MGVKWERINVYTKDTPFAMCTLGDFNAIPRPV